MVRSHLGLAGLLGCIVGSWACSSGTDNGVPEGGAGASGDTQFSSSIDLQVAVSHGGSGGTGGGGAPTPPATDDPDSDGEDSPERAIAEADILQLSGDRLYALSRYRGLSIIDVSNPAQLRLEGEYHTAAEPFEMYVEDGLVYALFNGWYSTVCDQAGVCNWESTSRVQALDARNPVDIEVLEDLSMPGNIADSRRLGDVLYLVTEQGAGYCSGCDANATVTVSSFDVSTPGTFAQVDQLRLSTSESVSNSNSVAVSNERIYIAGHTFSDPSSSVHVVDISDPAGTLALGTTFEVSGAIQSRWQMDEYNGVFRAVSQHLAWGSRQPPALQTFRINSSFDIQPIATLPVQLPRPDEVLRSARFDGDRGYLITAAQQDPLFTFDLRDPAAPRQLGELEMPGWVYHMEPRGNRVFALGFDAQNPDGALNVSLFDVEDLAEPKLLSRVAFGGDWGNFAEGQDQIHKAFSILADQGLILVPFGGATRDTETCAVVYDSGIQLVDFTDTTLTRRGIAPQVGDARRALLHRNHLFGIGDNAVQTFDIEDRDAPLAIGQLDVTHNVGTVRVLGDHLMRFGSNWWTSQTTLDLVPTERATDVSSRSEIELAALFGENAWSCTGSATWTGQVFMRGDYAYVPRKSLRYDQRTGAATRTLTFYVVDLSDRSAPRPVGSFSVEAPGVGSDIGNVLQTDHALLVARLDGSDADYANGYERRIYYDVFELSNPAAPTLASSVEVPADLVRYSPYRSSGCSIDMGWGWSHSSSRNELTDGDMVVTEHIEPVAGDPSRVKHYIDRIDVSDPHNPRVQPKINTPGRPIHFNVTTNELITLDQQATIETATDWEDCFKRGFYAISGSGTECRVMRRTLNSLVIEADRAVRKTQIELDRDGRTSNIAVSDSRVFYTTDSLSRTYSGATNPDGTPRVYEKKPVMLEALALDNGILTRLPSYELRQLAYGYWGELYARGDRVFERYDDTLTIIDTADPDAPKKLEHGLTSWTCSSLEVSADTAYCAAGPRGVEVIDLSSLR